MDDSCGGINSFPHREWMNLEYCIWVQRSEAVLHAPAPHCIALLFTQHGVFSWKRLGFGLGERGNESAYLSGYLGI